MAESLRRLVRDPGGLFSIVVLTVMGLAALLSRWVAPYRADELTGMPFQSPSAQHFMGTDELGRDLLSSAF